MRFPLVALIGVISPHVALVATLSQAHQARVPLDGTIATLLAQAQGHLSRGEAHEALAYYDAAVVRDPLDYLTLFKRATTQLSLGKTSLALHDFARALELEPGFEGAHVQLAKLKSRLGDWEGARYHYERAHRASDSAALVKLVEASRAAELAQVAEGTAAWEECARQASAAIGVANRATFLRQTRARCRLEAGDVEAALADLQHLLQLRPLETAFYVNISAITMYSLGDTQAAMQQARRCLLSDPDSKPCRMLLAKEKMVNQALDKITRHIGKTPMAATRTLVGTVDDPGLISNVRAHMSDLARDGVLPSSAPKQLLSRLVGLACEGYYKAESHKAQSYCEESLALDQFSLYGLLYQAKTQMEQDAFEAAINTYTKASENHPGRGDLLKGLLHEAQVALRRSQTRDYYKVLGVGRDADDRQIKSAYRKLSKQYHPDKATSHGLSKDEAEKKMAQINEAYEVLSDVELRARFDHGDDPNSPGGYSRPGFHFNTGDPFQHMFQQGGGPFKFHAGRGFPFN